MTSLTPNPSDFLRARICIAGFGFAQIFSAMMFFIIGHYQAPSHHHILFIITILAASSLALIGALIVVASFYAPASFTAHIESIITGESNAGFQ